MKVGVHQGSVLSLLLFIIVLEALSREFHSRVPCEAFYANDLVIIAESLEECVRSLLTWKEAMEKKGLKVNAVKTKIMICGMGLDLLQSSGEFPYAVCHTGVGSNSIFCNGCKHWVLKKCSGLKRLTKDADYRCTWCQGTAHPLDGRPQKEVQVGSDKLEVVASFCYLGDMVSPAGSCEFSTTTRVKTPGRSSESCYQFSLPTTFETHSFCVQSALCSMPVRFGHWKSKTSNVCSEMTGQWSDRSAMSSCKTVSPPDQMSYLHSLALKIWTSFWRREGSAGMDMWNSPMVQSRQPLTYRLMESEGLEGPRWHGNSWQRGIAESGSFRLSTLMIDGDLVWDLPCVQQACYPEGGPLMWMLPLYLHVNQKYSDDDNRVTWWEGKGYTWQRPVNELFYSGELRGGFVCVCVCGVGGGWGGGSSRNPLRVQIISFSWRILRKYW